MARTKGPIERNIRVNMVISEEERALLERLAARERITMSDLVRRWIYTNAIEHLGWTPERPTKRKVTK